MQKAIFSWSGGKDSMHALHEVMAAGGYEVTALLSTYNTDSNRVFMHGVRIELLREQTRSLGLPLIDIGLGKDHTSADYESAMRAVLMREKASGVSAVIFGDIFLEDLRQYRVDRLETVGMNAVFPLWKRDTKELARRFISLGYKAVVTCADGNELGEEYVGREYDLEFIQSLPAAVDPCGENGEFHTFVYDGPNFRMKIEVIAGEKILRDNRFWFCELDVEP